MLARILNRKIEHGSHYYCIIGLKFLHRVQFSGNFSLQRSQPPRTLITGVTVTATLSQPRTTRAPITVSLLQLQLQCYSYTRPLGAYCYSYSYCYYYCNTCFIFLL